MQKAVACSPMCLFPLHRDSFVLYVKVIYLPDYLTFWRMRHKVLRLACPVSKSFLRSWAQPEKNMLQRPHVCGAQHTGSPGIPRCLVRWLQTALLPFCLAALCIPCSAAVSAVPVVLEGMKAFHTTVSDFTEYSELEGTHKDHQVQVLVNGLHGH